MRVAAGRVFGGPEEAQLCDGLVDSSWRESPNDVNDNCNCSIEIIFLISNITSNATHNFLK